MTYKTENEKVAKLTRAIIDGSSRRYRNATLGAVYSKKPELTEMYCRWHNWILTDFHEGPEMQEMIDTMLLLYMKGIKLDENDLWLYYYGHMSTLFAKKISSFTNISKVAFMEQEQKEDKEGDITEWLFLKKDNS